MGIGYLFYTSWGGGMLVGAGWDIHWVAGHPIACSPNPSQGKKRGFGGKMMC